MSDKNETPVISRKVITNNSQVEPTRSSQLSLAVRGPSGACVGGAWVGELPKDGCNNKQDDQAGGTAAVSEEYSSPRDQRRIITKAGVSPSDDIEAWHLNSTNVLRSALSPNFR